ncbi:MAG: hypothetical protein WDA24_10580 [Tissierellales bacterium]
MTIQKEITKIAIESLEKEIMNKTKKLHWIENPIDFNNLLVEIKEKQKELRYYRDLNKAS